jgi:hypothetical protein
VLEREAYDSALRICSALERQQSERRVFFRVFVRLFFRVFVWTDVWRRLLWRGLRL